MAARRPANPAPPGPAPPARRYAQWLAEAAGGEAPLPQWRPAMYASTGANKRLHPDDYRDRWDDAESLAVAQADLARLERLAVAGSGTAAAAAAAAAAAT
jgi:hypothetical protein